jgi:hypothetical protein
MRHGHDVRRVGLLQLVDEIDDTRQLVDRFGEFVVGEFESRQHCNLLNLFFVE